MHILITGANRGIGKEISNRYRADGHTVTGTARDGSETVTLDVTDPAQHRAMAEQMLGKPVDLLICNAGVYLDKGQGPDGYPAEMWAQTFAANVTGVFLTVQALMPNLELAKGARIAIISSQMASHTRAPGGSYIYRASKAAALNLGRNLSSDLKSKGIAVGIYHPGWVRTDMGGAEGDISVDEAAEGLIARFAELDMASTGCFKTWDGRDHAY
ncbi:SDR family NAD(P)-dependent oxidoreductase [Tropicibacter sp. R16_0]|uniref:SDR family NAD(P)-dependent oxidoreductase n=1 Tax=Tropicibacter sp. R16_0 TaxID=2821102 RepID=UPI001ADCE1FB|nr:SDR family NAD(P)-dependent oxidoreductase [Tropicibacter sp. R16_0]MBO9451516.1 SDR family NAD(P)-dependent oxidoreductase [Tropicibacter sp. R16_0]